MKARIKAVYTGVGRFEEALLVLASCIMFISVTVLVVTRYFLRVSVPQTEELTRSAMIWLIMVGAAVGYRKRNYIDIRIVPFIVSNERTRKIIEAVAVFLTLISLIIFLVWTFDSLIFSIGLGERWYTLPIPLYWVHLSFLLGAALFVLHWGILSVETLISLRRHTRREGT